MISKEKTNLLYTYDQPLIWNLSCFGNEYHMFLLDCILDIFQKYGQKFPLTSIHGSYSCKYNGGRSALYLIQKQILKKKLRSIIN